MANVRKACEIAEFKYARSGYELVWIFDQSAGHHAYDDDALVATRMNVNPGGQQPKMHPGKLPDGREQQMVYPDGTPKGLRAVLTERGVNTTGMTKQDMITTLQQHDDFK